MPVGGLFDVTNAALDVALKGAEQRQSVLSNNLANVNVPGFKPQDVSFQDQLASALSSTSDAGQISQVTPRTSTDTHAMRADGNGVDVDRESANLAENQILFDTMMAIQTKKLHSLSSLITGAR
jgi:flagellar basal-body rod protein FlgB